MTPKFIIITDRGAVRAGWIEPVPDWVTPLPLRAGPAPTRRQPAIRWVEDIAFVIPRQHLVEQTSDMSGAFAATDSSGSSGGQPRRMASSFSDTHWKIAADRRSIDELSAAITRVLHREKPGAWSLSAPEDIHAALADSLPPSLRQRLELLIPKNLVRATHDSILAHFLPERPGGQGAGA